MMQFLRLAIIGVVICGIVFLCLFYFLKQRHQERLEQDYPETAAEREREEFVKRSVSTYSSRMARWLALAVFGVPAAILALVIYFTNFM
jgi:hypothetical protein